jgi:hypothetical protein
MRNKYRIVTDDFKGFKAQVKFWWFPFAWLQMGFGGIGQNSWGTEDEAEAYILRWTSKSYFYRTVVREVKA